jgi:hypothetical protein
VRTPVNNPFMPGSDRVPEIWAGRAGELADARDVVLPRRAGGVYERGRAFLGEFGIGKSVLVNRIARDAAAQGHWVADSVRVAVDADPLALLAESLRALVAAHDLDARIGRRAGRLLERVEEFTLPVTGGGMRLRQRATDRNAYRSLVRLLVEVATLARADERVVIVRIDEVQNAARPGPLSQLLTVLGDALEAVTTEHDAGGIARERVLPLVVYLSGLPDFGRYAAQSGATFSRRFRTVELEPLAGGDLQAALSPFAGDGWTVLSDDGPATILMEPGCVQLIVDRCVGDPFLFQLAGEAAWNAGTGSIITAEEASRGWQAARREVERYVEARLDDVTPLQLEFLRAAAALDDESRTGAAVARALGRASSAELASTVRSLDVEHAIIRRTGGSIRFRSRAVQAYLRGDWP